LADYLFPPRADGKPPRTCPNCETGQLSLKPGKFGFFIGCSNYPECKYTRQLAQDNTAEGADGKPAFEPRDLGKHPETGLPISVRLGPYGPYVQMEAPVAIIIPEPPEEKEENAKTKGKGKAKKPKKPKKVAAPKPKRASLPAGLTVDAVTFEKALELLALPRLVGMHPETGDTIEANNGRFGPYLKYQSLFVSIPKGDDLFTIGMNRAVDLIAKKIAKKAADEAAGIKPRTWGRKKKPEKKTATKGKKAAKIKEA
jgi:DNA topoisomerase-1